MNYETMTAPQYIESVKKMNPRLLKSDMVTMDSAALEELLCHAFNSGQLSAGIVNRDMSMYSRVLHPEKTTQETR